MKVIAPNQSFKIKGRKPNIVLWVRKIFGNSSDLNPFDVIENTDRVPGGEDVHMAFVVERFEGGIWAFEILFRLDSIPPGYQSLKSAMIPNVVGTTLEAFRPILNSVVMGYRGVRFNSEEQGIPCGKVAGFGILWSLGEGDAGGSLRCAEVQPYVEGPDVEGSGCYRVVGVAPNEIIDKIHDKMGSDDWKLEESD